MSSWVYGLGSFSYMPITRFSFVVCGSSHIVMQLGVVILEKVFVVMVEAFMQTSLIMNIKIKQ